MMAQNWVVNKNFFSENYFIEVFLFITVIISLLATTLTLHLLCKLRMLAASLVLHQVKEVGTVAQEEVNTKCKTLTYISLALTILGLLMVVILHYRKSKLCRCSLIAVKIFIFISDVQYYVPIKLCKTTGSIHLFKIIGMLKPENIKLHWNYILDTLEIDFNDEKINLPRVVTIKLKDKINMRCVMKKEPPLFHIMLKQGIT